MDHLIHEQTNVQLNEPQQAKSEQVFSMYNDLVIIRVVSSEENKGLYC